MEDNKNETPPDASTREAVRVDTSFKIEFRRVLESELPDTIEEITSHRTNDRLGYPPPESELLPANLDNLKDYQETTPYIMKMWVSIEQKLNVLIKLAGDKAHGMPNAEKGIVKDISAKGIKMKTDADLNKGEYLMLRISPPTFPSFILDAVGKVLSSDPAGKGARLCKVEFTALNPDDRETLIAYVFKRQREILRGRLEDETAIKEKEKENRPMGKWKCNSCDYIYSPEKGDISRDIPKDTPFENLPDGWVCPKCGSGKDNFKRT